MLWRSINLSLLLVGFSVGIAAADAALREGTRAAFLESADGTRIHVADVTFAQDAAGWSYTLEARDAPFTDHFLSMRPFKCLQGAAKHWCAVPYPYEIKRTVSAEDLTDLEYDFLYLWKGSTEYGINMWNGVYYKIRAEEGRLVGRLHEMDMDVLSAPPPDGELRPIGKWDIEEGDPDSHWLPVLVIE